MQKNKKLSNDLNEAFGSDRKKAIALIIKDLREKRDMTQKELADVLYVTDSTISHYEQGISVPTTEMIVKLAKYFDVSTDYLLNNCTDSINYSKQLNKTLCRDMTVGKAVSIILNASHEHRNIIAGVLKMIDENQAKTK